MWDDHVDVAEMPAPISFLEFEESSVGVQMGDPWNCDSDLADNGQHDWGELIECPRCGDDRCGVKCTRCDEIDWACDE